MSNDPEKTAAQRGAHTYRNVHAAEDSAQFVLSTSQGRINAEDLTTSARAVTCTGDMSDTTVQKVSGDHASRLQEVQVDNGATGNRDSAFSGRYGIGKAISVGEKPRNSASG